LIALCACFIRARGLFGLEKAYHPK
jgi:hypothetical protein